MATVRVCECVHNISACVCVSVSACGVSVCVCS